MRISLLPVFGSAAIFFYRLWGTIKELSFLEGFFMITSSAVFAYKKRKKFLPYMRNWCNSFCGSKSAVSDDENQTVANADDTMNKRKRQQDTQNKAGKSTTHSNEENRNLKKRPGAMGNKNSVETVEREPIIANTDRKFDNGRDTKTCDNIEPVKSYNVTCSMCKGNKAVNTLSDMPTMPGCFHRFCKFCFEGYFNDLIDWDVTMWLCPECGETSITDYQTYFKELSLVLQTFLMKDRAEVANTKLEHWFRSQQVCTPNTEHKEPPALYDCEMCLKKFRESELVGMPSCEHRFCTTCTFSYFNLEIEERDILACYCPFCVKGEDAKSKEKLFEYFTKLGQILKPHIYSYTFRKFEKKLEELRYTDLCIKCYSPVKAPNKYSRFVDCEYCSTKACTKCRLLWDNEHYTKSCEQCERALRDIPCHAHNMSSQPIDCVSCGERFLHVRDGTIVFSCPKCEAQMCRSCKSPFYLGVECPEGKDKCCLLFFHAHHPANCLFYLQHKKVDDLFRLLRDRNLKPERTNKNSYSCEVEVKKVLRGRTTFEKCGKVLLNNYLGLCKKHAVEFLASIILKNSLDTKSLLDEKDNKVFIKRGRKDGLRKEFDVATKKIEENELQLKASPSSWNNSDAQSSSLESSSEKTPFSMEVVTEASSKTESNVQTQPEVTYSEIPSTSKENEEVGASAPEEACSDCKELPDNSNILVGRMKEADARCENGPQPATAVTSYYFGSFDSYQQCNKCFASLSKEKVPVSKNSKSTKNKHLDEKNVYSESGEVQTKETLSNRKKKQSKGKNAYLDNSEVQKKENFSKMESKQPKELSEKLMLEAQLFGTDNVCASKFSSAISSRNSLNDYVEKRQTTCPNCRVHCDLTRQVSMWVVCYQCKGFFCGICKAYYNNGCGRSWCFSLAFHLHHHEICYYKRDIFGIDKLKLILKANKVDFVDTEPVSVVCLLREVYHCQNKPFRSDLCRYHYEDYLANLVLQNNLKTPSNWF